MAPGSFLGCTSHRPYWSTTVLLAHVPNMIHLSPQGEWKPRQVDNPDYKGKWVHPEIDNPEYTPDADLYAYEDFGVIGFDLWQVRIRIMNGRLV